MIPAPGRSEGNGSQRVGIKEGAHAGHVRVGGVNAGPEGSG